MINKRLTIGIGCMLLGGILVVVGLLKIPVVPVVLILVGGAFGFGGYYIFEQKAKDKPKGMEYGIK